MASVSVFDTPRYTFLYGDEGTVNTVRTLVVNNVYSLVDENNTAYDLNLAASSNVNVEAVGDIRLFNEGTDGRVILYSTVVESNVRTDTEILKIGTNSNNTRTTIIATSNSFLQLGSEDPSNTVIVGNLSYHSGSNSLDQYIGLPTYSNQFFFDNPVNVQSNLSVNGTGLFMESVVIHDHLVTYGNIYGCNLNVWKTTDSNEPENSNVAQVGFGFHINDNHQLELLKYSRFGNDKTVVKRVAMFGHQKFNEGMCNDSGIVFDSFDILNQCNLPSMLGARNDYVDLTNPFPQWGKGADGIFYNGNVGVFNANPRAALDVNGSAYFSSNVTCDVLICESFRTTAFSISNLASCNLTTVNAFGTNATFSNVWTSNLTALDATVNDIIATNSVSAALMDTSNLSAQDITTLTFNANIATACNLTASNLSTVTVSSEQNTLTSDMRLKNVLGVIAPSDCMDRINAMRVVNYAWKRDKTQSVKDGFIAQEVEQVMPHAILYTKHETIPDCRSVDYNMIVANLVGAVQHLYDIVIDRM